MKTLTSKSIVETSLENIWDLEDDAYVILTDDKVETKVTKEELIYTRYIWELFQRYPEAIIRHEHIVANQRMTPSTHTKMMSKIVWSIKDDYGDGFTQEDFEFFRIECYRIYNQMYNDMTVRLDSYVSSFCAFDITKLLMHPEIKAANDALNAAKFPDGRLVQTTHDKVWETILTCPTIETNPLVKAAKGGILKKHQILQVISARGLVTDADSHFFKRPVTKGFATGLTTLAEMAMESRSATKSVIYAMEHIRTAEYFNRLEQLCTQSLSNLHRGDCNTTEGLPFPIGDKTSLRALEGMYRRHNGEWVVINADDTFLIGETITLRTVYNCKVTDRNGVCEKCIGTIADSMVTTDNLGHFCVSDFLSKVVQELMSVKHVDHNVMNKAFSFNERDSQFLSTSTDDNKHIYLNKKLASRNTVMTFKKAELHGINDILFTDEIANLLPEELTTITNVIFTVDIKNGRKDELVNTDIAANGLFLTPVALLYLKTAGWIVDEFGNYQIDMCDWDYSKPFFVIPLIQFSTVDYMNKLSSFVKSRGTRQVQRAIDYKDMSEAIFVFHKLVSIRLTVLISHLQVILLALTTDASNSDHIVRDYSLPLDKSKATPAKFSEIMHGRSVALGMAYEDRSKLLLGIKHYLSEPRENHPFDVIFAG